MLHPLVDAARAHNVHVSTDIWCHILFGQPSADLDQECLSIPCASSPLVFQLRGCNLDAVRGEIVQHDDVGASSDSLVRFLVALAFDLDFDGKAAR
jgi:hypothetical protein